MRNWLICLLISVPALGQSWLTLAEVWSLANQRNLALQVTATQFAQADAALSIQRSERLPILSISAGAQYTSKVAEIELPVLNQSFTAGVNELYDVAVNVEQPLFTGFRYHHLIRSADEQQQAAALQKTVQQNQLYLQIGMLFYDMQLNMNQRKVLDTGIDRAGDQLEAARNRLFAGQVTAFDTLEAANRRLQLQSQQQQLHNFYRVMQSQLLLQLNTDTRYDIAPMALQSGANTAFVPAQLQEMAMAQRVELQQSSSQQAAQRHLTGALQSQYYPQVYAKASYHYGNPGVNFFKAQWMNYYTVAVGLQWQLWNGGKRSQQVQQSRLESRKLQLQETQLRNMIRQEVSEVLELLESSRIQINFQEKLVAQERERYRIARTSYDQGLVTSLDVRTAETALTQAELLLQQRWIDWHRQRLHLAYITGDIDSFTESATQ